MNILFVHNNFPAQFRHLATWLTRQKCVSVAAIASGTAQAVPDVRLIKYSLDQSDISATHPFARRFDLECRRAEQVLYAVSTLAASGFVPDVIVAHPGWGETIPLRTMFPSAKFILYCEFFYGATGRDFGFDPEFPSTGLDGHVGLQLKNASTLLALDDCDVGVSPTAWQRSTYPAQYHSKIETIHEGVDTAVVGPDSNAKVKLPGGKTLNVGDEVLTFVVRDLEPLRGYHIFMRALPSVLKRRPNAQVLIVGNDGTSYGAPPRQGQTWKSIFLDEVAGRIDLKRVHFLGRVPYSEYIKVLQISSAHVYLTYPFVLSWSCLEALSAGCVVIGSETAPVQEVIDGSNGILVPFFDVEQLANRVVEVLAKPKRYLEMRNEARKRVVEKYDVQSVCLPKMVSLLGPFSQTVPPVPVKGFWPGKKQQPRKSTKVTDPVQAERQHNGAKLVRKRSNLGSDAKLSAEAPVAKPVNAV